MERIGLSLAGLRKIFAKAGAKEKEEKKLLVEDRPKDGDGEVGEVAGAFVELKPAHDAMV